MKNLNKAVRIQRTVYVKPPINHEQYTCKFWRRQYTILPHSILFLHDVLVTNSGLCFKNFELIPGTVQSYPDKFKIFELTGKLELLNYPEFELDSAEYMLIIFHPWFNYYHWITESLPRIWLAKENLHFLTLLLPNHYKNISWVQESLIPFNINRTLYIPFAQNTKINNAVIPLIKPKCWSYDPEQVSHIRSFYTNYVVQNLKLSIGLSPYIYIIRGKSKRRQILNEEDVKDTLESFGFSCIDASAYSFFEQIFISMNSRCLVSNGSGLTNMQFMCADTSVLELCKKKTNPNDFHDVTLWYLASALDIDYYALECRPVDMDEDMYEADLEVDLRLLRSYVDQILSNSKI